MDLVEDFAEPGVSIVAACSSLGVSRATLYRGTHPALPPAIREYAPSPRRLGDEERQAIVGAMHSAEFVDRLRWRCSRSCSVAASTVGWMVAIKECKHLAAQLFAEAAARHGIEPGLVVHADRGAAMKSDTLAQLLATLGVDQSFSESQFKTLKYQPDYTGFFATLLHTRGWLESFFGWHNDEHHHYGLALFTPAHVFFGRFMAVHAARQEALDAAHARKHCCCCKRRALRFLMGGELALSAQAAEDASSIYRVQARQVPSPGIVVGPSLATGYEIRSVPFMQHVAVAGFSRTLGSPLVVEWRRGCESAATRVPRSLSCASSRCAEDDRACALARSD